MIDYSKLTRTEYKLIHAVAERAVRMAAAAGIDYDMMTAELDITACHLNGNPLRLKELAYWADDANFGHDIFGIRRFMNRETGKLSDEFSPRYSKAVTRGN
jgi:hypothetical protein